MLLTSRARFGLFAQRVLSPSLIPLLSHMDGNFLSRVIASLFTPLFAKCTTARLLGGLGLRVRTANTRRCRFSW